MKKFCIIGVSGFVAKKHLNSIKNLDGKLVAVCDIHANVGFLDELYPKTKFFNNENKFFKYISEKKIDYLVICTPTFLHFNSIKKGLSLGLNVIVEKPPLLSFKEYSKVRNLEKKYGKKCFCIFQIRANKKIIKLKKDIDKQKKTYDVKINYSTFRGDWYFKSWKNIKTKSGGLLVNIGIHFFDLLIWFFGDVEKIKFEIKKQNYAKGYIKLKKANVKWTLSTLNKKSYKKRKKFDRHMIIDKTKINFDNFNNLHTDNYKMIINKNFFHISEFEKIIKLIPILKK